MAALVDTTIRLLSQEPLAARVPTARLLEVAERLDAAGFAALEVSGGGCFDAAVRRGVESPWERIRALRDRSSTPLGMALRGRFLVGSRPLSRDLVRRFVRSAADNGIDVFRLHDPLNDLTNLREAAEAIHACEKELAVGLVQSPGPAGETAVLLERAHYLAELGAARVLIHDPAGSLAPAQARGLVERVGEASGLPVGLHAQGAGGAALAASIEAARGGADRIACAIYPVAISLHRVSAEALSQALVGIGLDTGVDLDKLWEASELVDEALGEEPVTPLSPRVAVRAAEHRLPAGLVAEVDANLRRQGSADRLDAVLEELTAIRAEAGWPPLASPIGQVLASQALIHVLSAQRWQIVVDELRDLIDGRYGSPPGDVDPVVRRSVELLGGGDGSAAARWNEHPKALDELRGAAAGLAASEEELLLLALFGEEAEALLRAIRNRGRRDERDAAGLERSESERLRDLIRVVQESGIGELTIEEGEWRVTVRRSEAGAVGAPAAAAASPGPVIPAPEDVAVAEPPLPPPADETIRVESPMVGTFYRAPSPGAPPFVEEGDAVEAGQTLCILEAMKLMNEVKAEREALVRRICVENAEPVEYGQLLFELEPLNGRPLDAL
ncbi:MAG TPA: acetyl-CoA carboxylase biotin carboxyl carrier protein [Gaiellaceae bacterium]|nr:acetyl-CoA carboxylase biotin carboxyl carrier protein [Gaiellaceae bacterium]